MIDYFSIPYLILSIISLGLFYLKGKKELFISLNFLLALIVTFALLIQCSNLIIDYYFGYFYETLAFDRQIYGVWFYPKILLISLALLLPLLSYLRRFRNNFAFQYLIFAIYFGLVTFTLFHIEKKVLAGWHTTIGFFPSFTNHLMVAMLGLLICFLMIKFKWLSEFREKK